VANSVHCNECLRIEENSTYSAETHHILAKRQQLWYKLFQLIPAIATAVIGTLTVGQVVPRWVGIVGLITAVVTAIGTVLLSGGIDSTACVHFYAHQHLRVQPVFVNYGQPASLAEVRSARAVCAFYKVQLRTIRIEGPRIQRSGEILARNLVLISCALMEVGLRTNLIAVGIHGGTRYFDCSPSFTKLCEQLLEGYTDGRVRIGAPFLTMDKKQIWNYCEQNGVPVHLTWSCEASSAKPCGKCLSCKDKESLLARA
jgi:7-cyano-7-deazaguanine synthase